MNPVDGPNGDGDIIPSENGIKDDNETVEPETEEQPDVALEITGAYFVDPNEFVLEYLGTEEKYMLAELEPTPDILKPNASGEYESIMLVYIFESEDVYSGTKWKLYFGNEDILAISTPMELYIYNTETDTWLVGHFKFPTHVTDITGGLGIDDDIIVPPETWVSFASMNGTTLELQIGNKYYIYDLTETETDEEEAVAVDNMIYTFKTERNGDCNVYTVNGKTLKECLYLSREDGKEWLAKYKSNYDVTVSDKQ